MSVTVIVPTYKPGEKFVRLMERLQTQTILPDKIIIINTEEKFWKESVISGIKGAEVVHISRNEFDHGKTRAQAAKMTDSEFLIYFTQDAVPADDYTLENLLKPFRNPQIGAVYGRQLPDKDCRLIESYTRSFNYPGESRKKTKADLPKLGIKTFFCSNVCAAYRKSIYEKMGGFSYPAIFNEDMVMAGNMIKQGYAVFYAADARVVHSHNYTWGQQFRRNFDLAVSQADHPEVFKGVPSEGEGMRLVKSTAAYLVKKGKFWLIPSLVMSSGFKFLGYRLGKSYKRLPGNLIAKCTMNKGYWKNEN